jgi:hypothetical protein
MSIKARSVIGWLAWAAAALGGLSLAGVPGEFGESLCGPWG